VVLYLTLEVEAIWAFCFRAVKSNVGEEGGLEVVSVRFKAGCCAGLQELGACIIPSHIFKGFPGFLGPAACVSWSNISV